MIAIEVAFKFNGYSMKWTAWKKVGKNQKPVFIEILNTA